MLSRDGSPETVAIASVIRLVVLVACAGVAACTYDFDKFAGANASSSGGTAGSRTQQDGNGGSVSAHGGVTGVTSMTGGAAGIVTTGGQAGASAGGAASGGRSGTDAGAGGSTASCAGPARGVICWYVGPSGSSCQQVCASHGQPAPGAATHTGTASQGGSLSECAILFGLLGVSGVPASGSRSDGLGLGCHLYNTALWWLSSPNFNASASHASAKLVCGCTQ
jgi:hypothetical protein